MKLPTEWPHRVKSGNVTIPIYRSQTSRGYVEYKAVWTDAERKRRFKTFADFSEAKKYAESVNAAIGSGEINAITLTNDDRLVYLRARTALDGTGVALDFAASEYANAIKQIGSAKFRDAIAFYAKVHRGVQTKTVAVVVGEFLAEKEKPSQPNKRPASDRYLTDMTCRLNRFADAFHCDMNTVESTQLKAFLDSLKVGGRTYVNYARAIATLFNFAKERGYFPKDVNPLAGIDTEHEDESEIEIFTPAEIAKLLAHASPDLLPFVAIGGFAGLRSAEISRLDWSEVKADFIEVKKSKSKTRSRRLVPIQPNLQKWLASHRKQAGKVIPFAEKELFRPIQELVEASGVKWKHNGLRHSFCSYRYAACQNENTVAAESGHEPQKLFSNYREVVTPQEAQQWFGICPESPSNVIGMRAA